LGKESVPLSSQIVLECEVVHIHRHRVQQKDPSRKDANFARNVFTLPAIGRVREKIDKTCR